MAHLPYKSTVSEAAASRALTTLETVKAELVISGTAHDTFLGALIAQASGKAAQLCNREFARETIVDSFRITRGDTTLQLSRRPIVSVSTVAEGGTTLAAADFEIIAGTGWLKRVDASECPQPWAWGKVEVTYVAGYDVPTALPNGLERVVIDEVKRHWYARERDPNLKSEEVPGVLRQDYWIGSGPSGIDPMLAALRDAGLVDPVL